MSKVATSDYDKFHRMVASPAIARSCINSFCESKGCILFMPSHATFQDYPIYDASNILNLVSYYALVVLSFTGLSTLLNCTKTIAIRDFLESGGEQIYPKSSIDSKNKVRIEEMLCSINNPELKLGDDILIYLQNYTCEDVDSDGKEDSLFLLRSFEYKFGLLGGLDVIMFHIASNDKKKLHLVEVYKLRNAFVNYIFSHLFHILGSLCCYIFEPKVLNKSLHKTKSN